ncbi:MAG: hybrid sensor histidine kinase/response regulator [Campylobacterota bacterium]|nr:hybrid sensor histidine kinase/response regulator [Campylobacterota bacterium]
MFKSLTALYVEDEEQIRSVVSSILKSLFGKLITAENGQEGLDLFLENEKEISVIITDINMPKLNGIDMCRKIREVNKIVPVIITTAHNDKDFLHKAIEVGISKFVTKPMDMKLLIESIKNSVEPVLLQQKLENEREQREEERLKSAKFTATGQLAAGITHEINTPLTYIKANIEMLGYDVEDMETSKQKDNFQESLNKINSGIHRIENIISSMKEISYNAKTEKVESNIYASLVTAGVLVYNKVKHISNLYINDKQFNIELDKNEFSYMALAQVQRLEQVWIIIINNAMDELMKTDHFNDRRLDISISEDDNSVYVIFKDNAGGINEDVLPHIFDPFKGTKDSSGMGVGLSIAKRIIDGHENATIEAYNEDKGAVFKIVLKK